MTAAVNALELTRQIVRMNTINPPGNEEACARHLGALLEDAGFSLAYHKLGDRRANLVARIGGKADRKPLCFTGHIDTVPLGAARWRKDPFAGETGSGKLYGRGTSDMKSGVAAFVCAAVRLGRKLERSAGLELVITAGEETGCQGAFDLVAKGALGHAGAVVVAHRTTARARWTGMRRVPGMQPCRLAAWLRSVAGARGGAGASGRAGRPP